MDLNILWWISISFEIPGEENRIHLNINSHPHLWGRRLCLRRPPWAGVHEFLSCRGGEGIHPAPRHQWQDSLWSQVLTSINYTTGLLTAMTFVLLRFNTRSSLTRGTEVTARSWSALVASRWEAGSVLLTGHVLKSSRTEGSFPIHPWPGECALSSAFQQKPTCNSGHWKSHFIFLK